MKVSRASLQKYFEKPLPSVEEIADAFTFHAFEIESVEGDVLDVKVLPNRAADCATEEGVATELSTILDTPLKNEPMQTVSDTKIRVSLERINDILGADFSRTDTEDVFRRLRFSVAMEDDAFLVAPPKERVDLTIPEDIAEEVGRVLGYDKISAIELPAIKGSPNQARYHGIERMKDQLIEQGFTEISTQSFTKKGDVTLANPLDKTRPALRKSLAENLNEALERSKQVAPLVLLPGERLKLFEVGTVFPKAGEYIELRMTERVAAWGDAAGTSDNLSVAKLEEYGKDYTPKRYKLGHYKAFSPYPFIVRDVALWVSKETIADEVEKIIHANAGELAQKIYLFDTFEKGDKKSLAFRMVLQSFERTLEDTEANVVYDKVVKALQSTNTLWQVSL